MQDRDHESLEEMVEVARFPRLSDARAASLALAAKDFPYTIARSGQEWVIRVEFDRVGKARTELEILAAENASASEVPASIALPKVSFLPLFVATWMLCGFFFVQQVLGEEWTRLGVASSAGIARGEWWRTVTALTLHGDLPHLVANLATGLLFAAFLQPLLGNGCAWLLIVLSGAAGNALNAWGYSGAPHFSLGASTAVFGALGLLVGIEVCARWATPGQRNRWSLVVPVGAGFALLAFLGVGDASKRIDIMAHLWGLLAGLPMGFAAEACRVRHVTSKGVQRAMGWSVLLVVAAAWCLALVPK